MSLRSVTFATPPVLTQDSQGPQTVDPLTPRLADQILCIRRVLLERLIMTLCPQCGAELQAGDPAGLCPNCLIQGAFDSSVGGGESVE
jgi:hypothetical protein